jgi:hypothetical protein
MLYTHISSAPVPVFIFDGKFDASLGSRMGLFDGKALTLEVHKYKKCTYLYDGWLKEMSANKNEIILKTRYFVSAVTWSQVTVQYNGNTRTNK